MVRVRAIYQNKGCVRTVHKRFWYNTSFQKVIVRGLCGVPILEFSSFRNNQDDEPWEKEENFDRHLQPINLAPLKGAIDADPVRLKVLKVLAEDGEWVTTADILRAARHVRSIVGAVTIGTILNGMNDLVSSRLIISRTSLTSGIDWAEWRINPDWLEPTRKLLQMMSRPKFQPSTHEDFSSKVDRLLGDTT